MRRTLAAALLVTVLGLAVAWWGTDGFRAYTAETARREQVLRNPRPLPDVALEDQNGRLFHLQDYGGRLVAVEFIYTRCETLCRSLGAAFKQIREAVAPQTLARDFALVSISFDPAHDEPPRLARYARDFGADGEHWRIARPRSAADSAALLHAFDIVVIPDGRGGYEHNAAIHLLDRRGRLVRISDIGEPARFVAGLREFL
ncbi:MAG: SCO family protein [Pseudomonadota bacterium]